jgi:hypothetical protein
VLAFAAVVVVGADGFQGAAEELIPLLFGPARGQVFDFAEGLVVGVGVHIQLIQEY